MKAIITEALLDVPRSMGLTTGPGSETQLDDQNLTQVFDVVPAVRRRMAPAPAWWFGVLQNTHGGAGDEESNLDPSTAAPFSRNQAWDLVGAKFDIWILSVQAIRVSGTGTIVALLSMQPPARNGAWGKNESGGVITTNNRIPLALFTQVEEGLLGAQSDPLQTAAGDVSVRVNQRIPRQGGLFFDTEASAISVYQLQVTLGLFPVGLGQDIAY